MKNIEKVKLALEAIEKSVDKTTLKEGTWALGDSSQLKSLLDELWAFKNKAYNICGDDNFFDALDNATARLEELSKTRNPVTFSNTNRLK